MPENKRKNKIKQIEKNIIKKISHDIFNINSKLFIKNYLFSLKRNYNKEIINLISENIDELKFKSLFRNVNYSQEYKILLKKLPSNKNLNKYKNIISMLIEYLLNNNFNKFYKFLIEHLKEKNRIFSFYEICKLNSNLFSNIKSWYIFGCPLSTDIDICVIVDKKIEGIPACPNYNSLKRLVKHFLKETKELDFNFITIDDRRVTSMKKGHEEIANILCLTYKYHKQIYQLPDIDSNIKVDYLDKMKSIGKLIVDNLEYLRSDYKLLRNEKKKAYTGGVFNIIEFSINYFNNINFINEKFKKDFLKKLVMKITQLLLSYDDIYEYTKEGLAKQIAGKYNQEIYENYALYYLTRGKFENSIENYSFILTLYNYYTQCYYDYKNNFDNKKNIILSKEVLLNIPIYNLPKHLFKLFLESPNNLKEEFEESYKILYPDNSINNVCLKKYIFLNKERQNGLIY